MPFDDTDQDSAVIPQNPPSWALRAVGWLVIAIFSTTLLASAFVRVPESVKCRYVLVPETGTDPIQSPLLAVVEHVRVAEGQTVAQEEVLFVLRSDEIRGWQTQLLTLREDVKSRRDGIRKTQESFASELDIRRSEIAQYEQEIEFQARELEARREILSSIRELQEQGIISTVELMEHTLKLATIEKDISQLQQSLQQVRLEEDKLRSEHSRRVGEEATALEKTEVRVQALEAQLANCEGPQLVIRAPYPGIVISLSEGSPGNVVRPAQELCQLARLDAKPHARLLLGEERLALLAPDQPLRLFFDAFPYQRYGTIMGRLDWISPAAVATLGEPQFIGLASLEENAFVIDRVRRPLRVGMTGEARIMVGNRSIAEMLFEPLRKLKERMNQ